MTGAIMATRATSLIALGRAGEAVPLAERSLAITLESEVSEANAANARAILGSALLRTGERARGRREILQARAVFAGLGERGAGAVAECDALLAE
jgi:hypothetical protein